ncbi:hypothetical protein H5410_002253 [Solanum commersonii]|uniref:Retrovirus-related Pol polyprotein from transposon TNT 1-94-like beta-barrel domain-containing protein n=1 Tax=Solanum commersonii TaxID=4109 RepID=A0A9J6B1I2_SOLCO|nr:hypothetical protein H5410_002253 [Solanum commersonii]
MEKWYNCGKKGQYEEVVSIRNLKNQQEEFFIYLSNKEEEFVTCHSNKKEELELAPVSEKLVDYERDWIVDSGCSNHMTGDKKIFINMSESKGDRAMVTTNNSIIPIAYVDKMVNVPCRSSIQVELQNSYHYYLFHN